MKNIAIFASGSGSNAQAIIEHLNIKKTAQVKLILTNKKEAYVIQRANNYGITCKVFDKEDFYHTNNIIDILNEHQIDFIVLAGFLWLVPTLLIQKYPNKIINIHPALLPKYGGQGMYGMNVHKAVIENAEKETGITIHYVNEHYDKGDVIFQAKCIINKDDTPESVAEKIHKLEYENFPKIVEKMILQLR